MHPCHYAQHVENKRKLHATSCENAVLICKLCILLLDHTNATFRTAWGGTIYSFAVHKSHKEVLVTFDCNGDVCIKKKIIIIIINSWPDGDGRRRRQCCIAHTWRVLLVLGTCCCESDLGSRAMCDSSHTRKLQSHINITNINVTLLLLLLLISLLCASIIVVFFFSYACHEP